MSPKMINGEKSKGKVLNWASEIDEETLEQAQRVADLPFIYKHLALMPDAHLGYGATIGSVIATKGAVIPYATGVDLGCGVVASLTQFTGDDLPDNLDKLHSMIAKAIPAGVGVGGEGNNIPETSGRVELTHKQQEKAFSQMGTLGSGNHFVEVCLDGLNRVWLTLHSGSRGIGNQLAQVHITEAKGLMAKYFIELEDPNLAYLVEGTPEFDQYIKAMLWSQDYALLNRQVMMESLRRVVGEFLGRECENHHEINCHHNFCQKEHHDGSNVWVTRKGAVQSQKDQWGVVPGSMGTETYIVRGKGNAAAFNSSSHGAGRKMSRSKAKKTLDLQGFKDQMAGKSWNAKNAKDLLDEDPRSYKDIRQVMEDQQDLVQVEHILTQILNYKGM